MQFVAQLIRKIRFLRPARSRNVAAPEARNPTPEFGHSTAGLTDCATHGSASQAQELLDAWMEEDRDRMRARTQRPQP